MSPLFVAKQEISITERKFSYFFCYPYCKEEIKVTHLLVESLFDTYRLVFKQLPFNSSVFTGKYTANYEMIKGHTVLSSSNAIYQNIFSADECGKLCSNYNGFSCKSFDYCQDLSTCYLGKTHYYDVPQPDIQLTPMCNHYSSEYTRAFK